MTTFAIIIPIQDVFSERGKVYDHERPSSLSVRIEAETPSVAVDMLGSALRGLVADEVARRERDAYAAKHGAPSPVQETHPNSWHPSSRSAFAAPAHDSRVAAPQEVAEQADERPPIVGIYTADRAPAPEPSDVDRAMAELRGCARILPSDPRWRALDVVLAEVERLRVEVASWHSGAETLDKELGRAKVHGARLELAMGALRKELDAKDGENERLAEERERQDQAIRAARDELARAIAERDEARTLRQRPRVWVLFSGMLRLYEHGAAEHWDGDRWVAGWGGWACEEMSDADLLASEEWEAARATWECRAPREADQMDRGRIDAQFGRDIERMRPVVEAAAKWRRLLDGHGRNTATYAAYAEAEAIDALACAVDLYAHVPAHKPRLGGGGCADDCAAAPPHAEPKPCAHERTWPVRWWQYDKVIGEGRACSSCPAELFNEEWDEDPIILGGDHVEPLSPHPLALTWARPDPEQCAHERTVRVRWRGGWAPAASLVCVGCHSTKYDEKWDGGWCVPRPDTSYPVGLCAELLPPHPVAVEPCGVYGCTKPKPIGAVFCPSCLQDYREDPDSMK